VVALAAKAALHRRGYPILAFNKARMGEDGAMIVAQPCPVERVRNRVARRRVGGVAGELKVILRNLYIN
jgi:hypothetical protein